MQRIKKKVGYVSFMGTEHRTIAQHEKLNRLEALNPDERMGGGGGGWPGVSQKMGGGH